MSEQATSTYSVALSDGLTSQQATVFKPSVSAKNVAHSMP